MSKILNLLILFSIIAYVCSRVFYKPEKYCYIERVGFRTESECKTYEKIRKVEVETSQFLDLIDLWYEKARDEIFIENISKEIEHGNRISRFME